MFPVADADDAPFALYELRARVYTQGTHVLPNQVQVSPAPSPAVSEILATFWRSPNRVKELKIESTVQRRRFDPLFLVAHSPSTSLLRVIGILVAINTLVIGVTYLEGTWFIAGAGIGLFEDSVHLASIVGQLFAVWSTSRLLRRIRGLPSTVHASIDAIAAGPDDREAAISRADAALSKAMAIVEVRSRTGKRAATLMFAAMLCLVLVFQILLPFMSDRAVASWVQSPKLYPFSWCVGILWNAWTFGVVAATALWVTAMSAVKVFSAVRSLISDGALRIVPLAPDGRGGVAFLGDLSLAQSFVLGSGVPWLVMWVLLYGVENTELLLGAPIYLGVITLLFFLPLTGVSWAMREAKKRDLERFSLLFTRSYLGLERSAGTASLESGVASTSHASVRDLSQIHSLYKMAEDMPIWPLDVQTLRRFASLVGVPVIAILQQLVSDLPWKNLFLQ